MILNSLHQTFLRKFSIKNNYFIENEKQFYLFLTFFEGIDTLLPDIIFNKMVKDIPLSDIIFNKTVKNIPLPRYNFQQNIERYTAIRYNFQQNAERYTATRYNF